MSVKNITIYNCDRCDKEFRDAPVLGEDKHFVVQNVYMNICMINM